MIRKSILVTAVAATLAAGSAFAADKVTGSVTQIDQPNGYIWLDNGVKYDVGEDFATGITPGNAVNLIVVQNGTDLDVVHASHAGF